MRRNEKALEAAFRCPCCYMEKENLNDQISSLIVESAALLKRITDIRKKADRFLWVLQTGMAKTAGMDTEAVSGESFLWPEKVHEELFVRKLTVKKGGK